jgi:hypothetical protein
MLPRVCDASVVRIWDKYCRRVRGISRKYLQIKPRYPSKKFQMVEGRGTNSIIIYSIFCSFCNEYELPSEKKCGDRVCSNNSF